MGQCCFNPPDDREDGDVVAEVQGKKMSVAANPLAREAPGVGVVSPGWGTAFDDDLLHDDDESDESIPAGGFQPSYERKLSLGLISLGSLEDKQRSPASPPLPPPAALGEDLKILVS
eukprot:Sspe_Gene.75813::Locus_47368_Transcript_1_1_Confidence_1.000_Length_587::g.75813::m.75813